MKTGVFHKMLGLLCCASLLFPQYALAGGVNIPGFTGVVTPRSTVAAPAPAPAPVTVNIPGFYGPAVTPPLPAQLPILKNVVQGATVESPLNNQLTIDQTQQQAIINWASFNIGAAASVTFNQQHQSGWVAVNRIWDANPTLIFGKLSADGKIYLINQNGILFGPGSKVNVNGLVASALNIKDNDFLNNVLNFTAMDYQGSILNPVQNNPNYLAAVSNLGEIDTADGGYVFLIAPRVDNYGTINAPAGQLGLIAGTDVNLHASQGTNPAQTYVVIINDSFLTSPKSTDANFGRAVNGDTGKLNADGGVAGMYGNNVDQWGVIRSVTAFKNNKGYVELMAANKITTGADSSIMLPVDNEVDPTTGLPPTISETFDIQPTVFIGGLNGTNAAATQIDLGGKIVAPAGQVTLRAANQVAMESGSGIDVSGVVADLSVAVITAKLNSIELRDDDTQKGGVLQGQNITTPVTAGSTIGNLSQDLLTQDKTAQERLIGGDIRKVAVQNSSTGQSSWSYNSITGNISVNVASGDIIVKQGASLNFAGGEINYVGGLVNSTKLLSGTTIYDISNAPANIQYDQILGNYVKSYARFGMQQSYTGLYYGGASPAMTHETGYSVGGDAGTLSLSATTIVLNGQINGSVNRGTYQNAWTTSASYSSSADYYEALMLSKAEGLETPRAGNLTINASNISVVSETDTQNDITPATTSLLSAKTLNNANLGTLGLTADLTISTAADAALALQPGGSFTAQARLISYEGQITVPGGNINLYTVQNSTSYRDTSGNLNSNYVALPNGLTERIVLGSKSVLDASGQRIDNSQTGTGNAVTTPGFTNGGKIYIEDQTDLGAGVFLQKGAVVNVSGGYSIDQKGKVTGGSAGAVIIQGANIELDGSLQGYALADPKGKLAGGAITLTSLNASVVPATSIPQWYDWSTFDPLSSDSSRSSIPAQMKGMFYLADNEFGDTGFTQITVNSKNDVTIGSPGGVNTNVAPSLIRSKNPVAAQAGLNAKTGEQEVPGNPNLISLDPSLDYMAGQSQFTAAAGVAFSSSSSGTGFTGILSQNSAPTTLSVLNGTMIRTTPGGKIILSSGVPGTTTGSVMMDGKLDSRAGTINVTATGGNLLIGENATILAKGFNTPDPSSTPNGFSVNHQPMNGGNVSLIATANGDQAGTGNLTIASGATIDVSGSDAVMNTVLSGSKTTTYQTAGNPGSVSLSYGGIPVLEGAVVANNANLNGLGGIGGGTLAMTYTYPLNSPGANNMSIGSYIGYFLRGGFDDLTFKSNYTISFDSGDVSYVIPRKLTLDAPNIIGTGNTVTLSAAWIVLKNTSTVSPQPANSTVPAAGNLTLSGGWTDASGMHSGFIDVIGSIQIDGFKDVTLRTDQDITLSQALYNDNFIAGQHGNPGTVNPGMLGTTGDLVLDAARIYPGNYYEYDKNGSKMFPYIYSDYTVQANGKVTLQHTFSNTDAAADPPIYSAGGSLTIISRGLSGSGGIDVEQGVTVAAPLGTINLNAPGNRIYLASGSTLTIAANVASVLYGELDQNNLWLVPDKAKPAPGSGSESFFTQDALSNKGINLNADEVITRQGSKIDVSGGGSVFAYSFQPGVQGSVDPLTESGRYVVFKADTVPMPGTDVYLQGEGGLSAGMYTLLPLDSSHPQNARYAFMPGAYILEVQKGASLPAQGALSQDGYPLVVGYSAIADTSIKSTQPQVYSVRAASEVLTTEGNYVQPVPSVSGNAGNINITGTTMILDGQLKAAAFDGYQGGTISLKASNITVQSESASPLAGILFDFNTPLSKVNSGLMGKLTISSNGITGFHEVDLGDVDQTAKGITNSITVKAGAELDADIISLSARGSASSSITLEGGSKLVAATGDGEINIITPGTLVIGDSGSAATLHAAHAVNITANNVTGMNGSFQSEGGALTLNSSAIFFDDGTRTDPGLHLTQAMWNNFTGFQDFTLVSNSGSNAGIQFLTSVDLTAVNSLTLDASRIANMSPNAITVNLSAPTINFKNSGTSSTSLPDASMGAATFTATAKPINAGGAGTINFGEGDILFDNFKMIAINSQNDLTLLGKGSLSTGNGDLAISAARMITASTSRTVTDTVDNIQTTAITAPDFVIYTGSNYNNDMQSTLGLIPGGAISINGNGNYKQSPAQGGGMLEIWGTSIRTDNGGVIQADGGTIKMVATGGDIALNNTSQILAKGTVDAPGGQVFLQSTSGGIVIDNTSSIDVSAGSQGDAGLINIKAPIGGVTINGNLEGKAQGGAGGSLVIDTYQFDNSDTTKPNTDMANLLNTISASSGGFTERIDLRATTGDIVIGSDVNAHHVKLTADGATSGGNIDVNGNIIADAEGTAGGGIELYAKNNLSINGGIRAVSTVPGSLDPNVLLSSTQGSVSINGKIDVSDSNGNMNGIVYLRALRNANNNDISASLGPQGSIVGQSTVYAEAVDKPVDISSLSPLQTLSQEISATTVFYNNYVNNTSSFGSGIKNFHLLPGIELYSAGDINWNTALDLTDYRFGGEPGVLTIRSAGNLNINASLADAPAYAASGNNFITAAPAGRNSWGFNLVAGADPSSADYMAINTLGTGNLTIADNVIVYTESAPIRFASGGDTVIGTGQAISHANFPSYMITDGMYYNLASFTGSIRGNIGRDLNVYGAIQTATGDIDINVGRDLNLFVGNDSSYAGAGAIRTTGQLSAQAASDPMGSYALDPKPIDPATGQPFQTIMQQDPEGTYWWRYTGGGSITLEVGRQVGKPVNGTWVTADGAGQQTSVSWDYYSQIYVTINNSSSYAYYGLFSADYIYGTAGLATMGGGNLSVRTGGDFLAQAGTFGSGNLAIYSGGDIRGRFLNAMGQGVQGQESQGIGEIHAMGNVGASASPVQIELINSKTNVTAQGEIQVGAVVNPSLASDQIEQYRAQDFVYDSYTPETSISLKAGTDVTLAGRSPYYENPTAAQTYERVLPAHVSVVAGGNLYMLNDFTLASASDGNLSLDVRGDVIGQVVNVNGGYRSAQILVSDLSPDNWYGLFYVSGNNDSVAGDIGWIANRDENKHGIYNPMGKGSVSLPPEPLHLGDSQPIVIQAGGNIENLNLLFPKKAEVIAGQNIENITYDGQNIDPKDVSMIRAGGDISMQYVKASSTSLQGGLIEGGPGVFLVQAGGSINLGSLSGGIQEIGNGDNAALGTGKSSLVVMAGYSFDIDSSDISSVFNTAADVSNFFSTIQKAGDDYAKLLSGGKLTDAATLLQNTRNADIAPLEKTASGRGDIDMTASQILTSNAASDIFVIANGNLNLGTTALPSVTLVNTTTGITTANGGTINIFAVKDVDVQESRVMTFFSQQDVVDPSISYGDITVWSDDGNINAGRGSRTAVNASAPKTVFDTSTHEYKTVFTPPAVGSGIRALTYGENPPMPGNVHLFAPTGVIDAGEAGIAGSTVTLAALKVTNVTNITFSVGSVGVPQQSVGTANIGSLSGTGNMTQNTQLANDVSGLAMAQSQASQMIEDIVTKWLDVKVIDFVEDAHNDQNDDESKKK
ncbi:MAG TPA: filamentous hemagglutinin family protein [Nitrospirota bacterium]|nr:filamentous hemagglutinin family protein [Nitrospirota bacterium]